jgi:hypothetical protein
MMVRFVSALALAVLFGAAEFERSARVAASPVPQATASADFLIQAGHEGRPDCGDGGEPPSLCNNTGSPVPPGEIVWTPIVADEATHVLRAAGMTVLREPAHLRGPYFVRDAVFLHFDGAVTPCSSAASVGYPDVPSGHLAAAWKTLYGHYWPFGFQGDNFTKNLHGYYGYSHVRASDGAMVIEFGEMSCPKEYAWLKQHLRFEGDLLAYFLSRRLGKGSVPLPAP